MAPTAYMKAAKAIYEPQKTSEAIALKATKTTTINSLEAEKGQISTDYQDAIDKLTQSVQDQTSQINQLYTERLGGNFSGLQGNDLGNMFARANQQQAVIGMTRANKLAQITTGETNAKITYGAGVAALKPKYQSLETQYAQSSYGSALKAQQTQANNDRAYALSVARFNRSGSGGSGGSGSGGGKTTSSAPSVSAIIKYYKAAKSPYGGYNPNSTNYHRWAAAEAELKKAGYDVAQYKKILAAAFGSAADKAQFGVTGYN